jgi:LemA protein
MKKKTIIWIIVAVILVGGYLMVKGKYNTFVTKDEIVQTAWSQVENQYQRRFDLIPNLVSTVKGYAAHEKDTYMAITEARASVGQMKVDVHNAEQFAQYQNAQTGLTQALSKLLMIREAYPDLKANTNFIALMTELSGTENRISTERMRYNDEVKSYNITIRQFPSNLFAGMFGFEKAHLFEMEKGAEEIPTVEF